MKSLTIVLRRRYHSLWNQLQRHHWREAISAVSYLKRPTALTIAGSDPSAGAGIQADLAVFAAFGVHGASVLTAITAQNSLGVHSVYLLPPQAVEDQLKVIQEDFKVKAAKLGMLGSEEIIRAVLNNLPPREELPLVVDTVLAAKDDTLLLTEKGRELLKQEVLPRATVITPNLPEAEILLGYEITNSDLEQKAAYELYHMTGATIVLKGGHRRKERSDLVYAGQKFIYLPDAGIKVDKPPRGTGCIFSAAIAAMLARGELVIAAVSLAKDYVNSLLCSTFQPGRGYPYLFPLAKLERDSQRGDILEELHIAFRTLKQLPKIAGLVPEVGMNIAYCLPCPKGYEDVAGFPGKITVCEGELTTPSGPRFGGSRHTARVVLAANRFCSSLRCAMPIRYEPKVLELLGRMGLSVGCFDRALEPQSEREGGTLEWGTTLALVTAQKPLDVIYDLGGMGKEPIIRLLGETPHDLIQIIMALLELWD